MLLLAEDRTESYRLDEVRRDFVANISHELKTPIGAVSLLAEALDQAADEPDAGAAFRRPPLDRGGAARAHHAARSSSSPACRPRTRCAPTCCVDIDEVVAAAVDQNRVVAAAKHGIDVAVAASPKAEVYGDGRC